MTTRATIDRRARREPGSRPMHPADAFFWYAEAATPELRPLVAGLFLLDRAPDRLRCRVAIERATHVMPRLRQCVAEAPFGIGLPSWRSDPEFDLDYHVREVLLPPPATQERLLGLVGAVFSTPLDHLRPLWEAHLIGGLAGGRAALFMKLHHAVLDGVGSNALFDALSQARRADPVAPAPRRAHAASAGAGEPSLLGLLRGGAAAASAAAAALADPADVVRQLGGLARGLGALAADASAGTMANGHAGSGIGRRLGVVPLSLPRLRRLKTRLGCTLNDLVLTLVSGALARYRRAHASPLERLTCVVPVNLRRADEGAAPGNRVGGFTVRLPLDEPNAHARLADIQAQTQRAKRGGHGVATQLLMQASALIPAAVFRRVAHQMAGRTQLICSNVPGPPVRRYLAGARIDAVFPFAPVMFGTPLAIAMVSYGPTFGVGLAVDPAVMPDPEILAAALGAELDALDGGGGSPAAKPDPHR
ncbi:MAG: wax ester/triacylglycerol synthase family O-acyltransferase [bacterium]